MTTTVITEDYVSFEVAKLLKEKGFQAKCTACYHNGQSHTFKLISGRINYCNPKFNKYKMIPPYNAPTLQMACKWLREEKGIAIIPTISSILDEEKFLWDVEIVTTKNKTYRQGWVYEHQEEAINTAIQWTLENLI